MPLLFAVPILALLGFAEAGREVLEKLSSDPAWREHITSNLRRVVAVTDPLNALQSRLLVGYAVVVLAAITVLAARVLRDRLQHVTIAYDDGASARGRRGLSILELSRLNHVPHAHVCSGRGRCGTCRVRIDAGAGSLSPMSEAERSTLSRVGASAGERLACQARVQAAGVVATRVLPPWAVV
jgi:adenylate cyclase